MAAVVPGDLAGIPLYVPLGDGPITYDSYMITPLSEANDSFPHLTEAELESIDIIRETLYDNMEVNYELTVIIACTAIISNYIGWYILTGDIDLLQHELKRMPIALLDRWHVVRFAMETTHPRTSKLVKHQI